MADVKLTPEITDILKRSTVDNNILRLPEGQLDRKVYMEVAKAIKNAGGAWKTPKKGFVFDGDPMKKLGLALDSGVVVDEKKKFQAFFTPESLAARMAYMSYVKGFRVLEPSAGCGNIADACKIFSADHIDCIEINPEFCEELVKKGYPVIEADFLTVAPSAKYDRVVMNPPFTKNQDVNHVAHALKFLKSDGILTAIMSPNTSRKAFQELVKPFRHEITPVDAGEFKESGTSIATIILQIFKP